MIGIKDQCYGVEVEMTGITREQAAHAVAEYFGTTPRHGQDYYDSWYVKDPDGPVPHRPLWPDHPLKPPGGTVRRPADQGGNQEGI